MSNLFSRGYNESRERMARYPKYSMSCFNCEYYYQTRRDKEEVCQNNSVLEYDMVVEGNNIYCLNWKPSKPKETMSEKVGRSRLD